MRTINEEKLEKAFSLQQKGNLDEAGKLYRQIIEVDSDNSYALHFLGVIEAGFRNLELAKSLMARSVTAQPSNIQFIENYAAILFQAGDYKSALQLCRQELQQYDSNVSLLYICAISSFKQNEFQESLHYFDRLLSYQPDNIIAMNERGSVHAKLKQYGAAFADFKRALTLNPQYAESELNVGNLFCKLDRYDEAIAAFDRALALKPGLANAWLGRGNSYRAVMRYDEAIAAYDRALALQPDLAGAWFGRGNVFLELKRYDAAFAAYDKAMAIRPDFPEAQAARLQAKMHLCDWDNYDAECESLVSAVRSGNIYISPYGLLGIPSTPADLLQCAKLYVADKFPASPPIWLGERYDHDRIRIAYLSTDYRIHPVGYSIAELLGLQNREKFEVIGISLGPDDRSEVRARIASSFDQFHDVRGQSDLDIARLIRRLEIEILVDLNNYSSLSRPGILAHRPAPVQVSYLGYPSTMGADFIDYAIVDKFVLPNDQRKYWTEKLVYMPSSFMAHDTKTKKDAVERAPKRTDIGLPEDAFVFCCFNNSFKITPPIFQIWMRLLNALEGSVLWLSDASEPARRNLRNGAKSSGVDPGRLIFAPKLDLLADHLCRHGAADLFLDTLPYNAHTTAADALWAGLPILTCAGETFPARVAGSLLNAIGLPEMVTQTLEQYEALALRLARDPALLADKKIRLIRHRGTHPLFDTALFTRHLDAAFASMWERYRLGKSPEHIVVEPLD